MQKYIEMLQGEQARAEELWNERNREKRIHEITMHIIRSIFFMGIGAILTIIAISANL